MLKGPLKIDKNVVLVPCSANIKWIWILLFIKIKINFYSYTFLFRFSDYLLFITTINIYMVGNIFYFQAVKRSLMLSFCSGFIIVLINEREIFIHIFIRIHLCLAHTGAILNNANYFYFPSIIFNIDVLHYIHFSAL